MAIETVTPRSRRALLAASLGGLAALAAQALGRPLPARATDPNDVVLGATNTATATTKIANSTNDSTVFWGASGAGAGVYGTSDSGVGVAGSSWSSYGVAGSSSSSYGVYGYSGSSGVVGRSGAADQPATVGQSVGGSSGLLGYSGTGALPAAPAKTGVYGYAVQDSASRGVTGQTTAGRGVYGQATSGYGVRGYATSGTAMYAASADPMAGYALRAIGRVKLDKCAGVATILSTTNSIAVTPGIDLVSTSAVVATLQGNPAGTTTVKSVAVDATANTFTIYLTANSTANVKVAWHVFG